MLNSVGFHSRPLGDVAVDEGQKLRITTPVKGNPVPTFTWTKDGKPIDPKRVHFFSDGELVSAEYFNSFRGISRNVNSCTIFLSLEMYKLHQYSWYVQ